ncbi:MAG: PAS domain S-box protein [Candidatus Lokiarchaeota archaeon]|nr:PAS domain S-box protein [Candidatus Lokiarchaeota archaeon]
MNTTTPLDSTKKSFDRQKFHEVAESMQIAVLDFNMDLELIYANPIAMDIFDFDEKKLDECISFKELVVPEQVQNIEATFNRLISGEEPQSMTIRAITRNDVHIPFQVTPELILEDGEPIGIIIYAIDLSTRVATDHAMMERAEYFRLIVEYSSFAGMVIIDDQYHFEWFNDKFCEILGYSRQELIQKDFREVLHPDSLELTADRYRRRQQGESVPPVYEIKVIRKDGSIREVILSSKIYKSGKGLKSVAQVLDVTEQKQQRRALEKSERRYRTLVETIIAGLGIDDANGIIIYANETLSRMTGYTTQELVGMKGSTLVHELTPDRIQSRREGKFEQYEAHLVTKSGTLVPVIVSASPLMDSENNFEGSFAIFTDISQLKSVEDEVRFLLDLILHDIGNQLQLIIAGSGLIEGDAPEEILLRAKEYILDGAHRSLDLITKVRGAEQAKTESLTPIDITEVIESESMLLWRQHGVMPDITGVPNSLMVLADGAVNHLIWNILENAVKHNTSSDPEVWIEGFIEDDCFLLEISDNGPGLDEEKRNRLFDVHRRYGGVGLHIVRRLAEKYCSLPEVSDRIDGHPGEGLTIRLRFHLAKDEP